MALGLVANCGFVENVELAAAMYKGCFVFLITDVAALVQVCRASSYLKRFLFFIDLVTMVYLWCNFPNDTLPFYHDFYSNPFQEGCESLQVLNIVLKVQSFLYVGTIVMLFVIRTERENVRVNLPQISEV